MKLKMVWIPACFAVLFLAGCPTELELESSIELSTLGRVYTAGYSTGVLRAYYWVDDILETIAEADAGIATKASCVVPTILGDYVAGTRMDFVDPAFVERAILWFNGKGEFLDDSPSFALAAVLHDGKIFVAGWRDSDGSGDRPCVWEVNDTWTVAAGGYVVSSRTITRHDLDADDGFGNARDIVSDGSDIYVCGIYYIGATPHACYWENGHRTDLTGGTWAESICVDAGTVYVGGGTALNPCYWVDGEAHEITGLPSGSSEGLVTAIAPCDDGLVLGGSYYRSDYFGFKWDDGSLTAGLPRVIGACPSEADLYLGCEEGWFKNGDYTPLPWIGGTVRPRGIRMRFY